MKTSEPNFDHPLATMAMGYINISPFLGIKTHVLSFRLALNDIYTTLNKDWKQITQANTFLCKNMETILVPSQVVFDIILS